MVREAWRGEAEEEAGTESVEVATGPEGVEERSASALFS